jgi:hypothetical protein
MNRIYRTWYNFFGFDNFKGFRNCELRKLALGFETIIAFLGIETMITLINFPHPIQGSVSDQKERLKRRNVIMISCHSNKCSFFQSLKKRWESSATSEIMRRKDRDVPIDFWRRTTRIENKWFQSKMKQLLNVLIVNFGKKIRSKGC